VTVAETKRLKVFPLLEGESRPALAVYVSLGERDGLVPGVVKLEGVVFRYRAGCASQDVPERFGLWQTLWKRHAQFSRDGTWDRMLERLLSGADAVGQVDWQLPAGTAVSRVR